MANYRGLSRNRDMAAEQKSMFVRQQKQYETVKEALSNRQRQLLVQLKEIYSIERESELKYKINGIYLPNANTYKDGSSNQLGAVTTSTDVSVALGYVGHIVLLCSSILNIPLRYDSFITK